MFLVCPDGIACPVRVYSYRDIGTCVYKGQRCPDERSGSCEFASALQEQIVHTLTYRSQLLPRGTIQVDHSLEVHSMTDESKEKKPVDGYDAQKKMEEEMRRQTGVAGTPGRPTSPGKYLGEKMNEEADKEKSE